MIAAILDFEATDKEPTTARITEIGVGIFYKDEMTAALNLLVYEDDYPEMTEEVISVTGIDPEMLRLKGVNFVTMCNALVELHLDTNFKCVIAHNKKYDKTLFESELIRHKHQFSEPQIEALRKILKMPWVCSIEDIEHEKRIRTKCRVLSHLCLEYGIHVNPSELHRAMGDVGLLIKLLQKIPETTEELVARSQIPWVIIQAIVPSPFGKGNDGGVGKDKAKACGFGWQKAPRTDGPEYPMAWVKRVRKTDVAKEREELGYEIKEI